MSKPKSHGTVLLFLVLAFILILTPACSQEEPELEDPPLPEDPTPPPPALASWYVAPGGNDGATGSLDTPFRTIARALESCAPGEAVVLRGGTYNEAVRIRQPRITLMGYSGETAIIQIPVNNEDLAICVEFDVDSSGGSLKNLEIVGGYYYAVSFETRWDWGEANRGGASDMLIENCRIHHSGRDCVKIKPGCDRITIRGCEIHHSGAGYPASTPEDDKNAEGIDNVNGDQMTVTHCSIHDIASTGIYFKGGATGCLVERCLIQNCGAGGVMVGFDTSPEYFDLTVNSNYYEAIGGTVKNCIITDTGYAGIGLYGAKDCSVLANTLVNTARKGHAPLYFGITFQDWEPEAKRPASISPRLINNLVLQQPGFSSRVLFIRYSEELGGLSSLQGLPTMSNNLYFSSSGAARFGDQRPGSYLMDASLTAWQGHIAGDAGSFEADPLLDSTQHLSAASPAQGRGKDLAEVTNDIDGQNRNNPPDIGADEG